MLNIKLKIKGLKTPYIEGRVFFYKDFSKSYKVISISDACVTYRDVLSKDHEYNNITNSKKILDAHFRSGALVWVS